MVYDLEIEDCAKWRHELKRVRGLEARWCVRVMSVVCRG